MDEGAELSQLNDRPVKLDIREWSPDHEKMGKGITLTEEEGNALKNY